MKFVCCSGRIIGDKRKVKNTPKCKNIKLIKMIFGF